MSINADGRFIAFSSPAFDLVPDDFWGVFVLDRLKKTAERVNVSTTGEQANTNGGEQGASISGDGRYVVFSSNATNLVPGDTTGNGNVFLRDREAETTELISVSAAGGYPTEGWGSFISGDGRFVVFGSDSEDLVPQPLGANVYQIYVRDRGDTGAPVAQFSGTPTADLLPLTVAFTDLSSRSPTSWSWDFGDGGTSTEQNPSHTYASAGIYIVSLAAANLLGTDTCTKDGYITVTFTDVPLNDWALYQILACVNAGVVQGYSDGSYHPDDAVTRDQMAVFVARGLANGDANVPAGPATPSFSDVPADQWAYKYIQYCQAQGIVQGYGDGSYQPGETVSRGQMAAYIARAVAGGDSQVPASSESAHFPDVPSGYWAFKYVQYCYDNAIVAGHADGDYHPERAVWRDQMAVFMQRAFQLPT